MAANLPPFLPVPVTFAGATAAGSGAVNRWTYTVPANKRAIVSHAFVKIVANTAAAATIQAGIFVTIGGTTLQILDDSAAGVANSDSKSYAPSKLDLSAGDSVTGQTINNSVVAVTMTVNAVIREYQ